MPLPTCTAHYFNYLQLKRSIKLKIDLITLSVPYTRKSPAPSQVTIFEFYLVSLWKTIMIADSQWNTHAYLLDDSHIIPHNLCKILELRFLPGFDNLIWVPQGLVMCPSRILGMQRIQPRQSGSLSGNFNKQDEDYVNSSVIDAVEVKSGTEFNRWFYDQNEGW
ncbi:hypothetical protein K1719_015676 [Acacia pycnantha]|nr:hypothetical protein K1719_015676 [Acacia pycnantha]